MTNHDQATLLLLADLEAAPPSPKRDAILERARVFKYHDVHAGPKIALYDHLQKAGLSELADNVLRGKYDQDGGEARQWVERVARVRHRAGGQRASPDSTPNPEHDSKDQKRLRALGRDLTEQMRQAGVGGVVILFSRASSSWQISPPEWSGMQLDVLTGQLRLKINGETPEAHAVADATLGAIADIAGEVAAFFAELFERTGKMKR